jgi:hypothetical protein
MKVSQLAAVAVAILALGACERDSPSRVRAPGADESGKTKALEAGAELLQQKAPLRALNAYLNGFHFENGDMGSQMEAHHFCGHINQDVIQCVLFDGNGDSAKLVGIEYIISATLFASLPAEEKHLWHSHAHEVKSGQLIAPGIPLIAEHELMEQIVGTYGKTWHTWHTGKGDALPVGVPALMMGFTRDGQLDERLLSDRDTRLEVRSNEIRAQRTDIVGPVIDTDADAWEKGIVMQIQPARQVPSAATPAEATGRARQ